MIYRRSVSAIPPAAVTAPAPELRIKVATEAWEFEQIHQLNYRTFVEEIPQHAPNPEGRLVDRFHAENAYVIVLHGRELVGMLALRHQRPFSLDSKVPNLDAHLPAGPKARSRLRLLAIVPEFRKTAVFAALFEHAVRHCVEAGFDTAVISATTRQVKLYRHLGCHAVRPAGRRGGRPLSAHVPHVRGLWPDGRGKLRPSARRSTASAPRCAR